ncbi:hypothetical protein [Nocardia brasiliensis]|uniref:hypothetical protein n=1 Tax=Nocardia brasiliensis TaxID=37326 RepID=UPI00340E9962
MRPLIIPHGAWRQPAHYDEVTQRSRRDGVDVTVPDLAGRPLADRADVLAVLRDHP